MSQNIPKTFSSTKTVKPCENCGGSGSLVIYNAYDADYRQIAPCEACKGTGFVQVEGEYGPN